MASTLSKVMGSGEQSGDGTGGDRLRRAASRGMREMVKGVVKEAIEESATESRRSGGSSRGMAMLGLGAIAGYLVRDWQLRPEMYEQVEEELAEVPEQAEEARRRAMGDEDEGGSWMGRLGSAATLVLLAGVGYAMMQRRRRSQRGEQWTEQRGQESQGGLTGEGGEMGGDAGRMGGESGEMGGGGMGGESGREGQETTTGGGTSGTSSGGGQSESSESSMGGSSEDEESGE